MVIFFSRARVGASAVLSCSLAFDLVEYERKLGKTIASFFFRAGKRDARCRYEGCGLMDAH